MSKIKKKDKIIYNTIAKIWNSKKCTIEEACNQIPIKTRTYYNICKRLNLDSIAKTIPEYLENITVSIVKDPILQQPLSSGLKPNEQRQDQYTESINGGPILSPDTILSSIDSQIDTSTSNNNLRQLSEVWEQNHTKNQKVNVLKVPIKNNLYTNIKDINVSEQTRNIGGSTQQKTEKNKTRDSKKQEHLNFLKEFRQSVK